MGARECDNLIIYLAGELSDSQAVTFKDHLKACSFCSQELDDLQETWFSLSYDREDREAPQSLKADITRYVFEEHDQANLFVPTHTIFSWMKTFKKIGTPLKTGLIGVLLIVLLGLGWNNVHLRTIMSDYKQLTSQEPISIKPTFNLQPQNSFSQAKGVVYIVHEGKQNRLIMQVDHIPQTKGTEIFQAWLLYDGKYWSCGTFRSNQSGEGALTYLVPSTVQVEGFKITLEPHTGANQPHGPAILKAL